ncbi:cell wall-binding repeat-containing protein [Agromyces albus]|uniref:cell wall-binding repeat-containing protein n=1 Tax=Agromyces albus TaxID=205332 RepID=UPI0027D8A5D9|nr:cell wall-binding repeat-containing protein [Agromyces albus]
MTVAPLLITGFLISDAAAPAIADTGVTVSGTVTHETPPGDDPSAYLRINVALHPLFGSAEPKVVRALDDGTFAIHGVMPGRYRVHFSKIAPPPADYSAPTWWGGTPHESQARILEVGAQPVSGIDARLEIGSTISGVITYDPSNYNGTGGYLNAKASAFLFDHAIGEYERRGFRAVPDGGGNYTFRGLPPGTYTIRFGDSYDQQTTSTAYWDGADDLNASTPVEVAADQHLSGIDGVMRPGDGLQVGRIAGPDRFATAVEISRVGFPSGSEAVFIVNGLNFPDALGAAPAAARIGAPILLVTPNAIPDSVKTELARLDPATIFIVGGEVSVSLALEGHLRDDTTEVVRFGGIDRFETSRMVADYFWSATDNRTAYIATGLNFPDALSAAPAAANEHAPVVLVNGAASELDEATGSLLEQLGIEKVVVTGGESTVSAGVKASIDALLFLTESSRRSGPDRFETSLLTNRDSFRLADTAFLATGSTFPDALAGAALAGGSRTPIYLVHQDCVPSNVLPDIYRLGVRNVTLLGGESTLTNSVYQLKQC